MFVVPRVFDATHLPFIAAGGIVDGRAAAASFMLGACGVQVGTRFLSAYECGIHRNFKDRVLRAGDLDTIVTGKRLGHPVRSLKTPFSRAYWKAECSGTSDEELEKMGAGAFRIAVQEGDIERGCFLAGQVAAMAKKEQPAAEIVRNLAEEAERILAEAPTWVK